MTNLTLLKTGPRAPEDLSSTLRELADRVDAGLITEMVIARVDEGFYNFTYGANLQDSLTLATLLQEQCIERYKR